MVIDNIIKTGDVIKQLNEVLSKHSVQLDSAATSLKMLARGYDALPSDIVKQIIEEQKAEQALLKTKKERVILEQKQTDLLAKKARATNAEISLENKKQSIINRSNKQAERQAILTKKNNREYNKLQNALTKITQEAQDVLVAMFNLEQQGKKNTKEYENLRLKSLALVNTQQVLDKGIKKVDASLGKHQREVGNYSLANQNMIPILGRVDYQLQSMGLSLDTLGSKPNAFKALASGIMGMGKALIGFALTPLGATLTLLGGLYALISSNKQTVIDFDSGLKNVGKTTGLAGEDLKKLGDETIKLSRRLGVVDTKKLQEYQTVAGQLGVKGTDNIIKFSESLAKLEIASDIQGEEGASEIARFLTLTDGGVENVKDFGDEIVNLGNNFAATESRILSTALSVAQGGGTFRVTRQQALALGTSMAAVGAQAELAGSVVGRTFGELSKSIRTGKNLDAILKLTGRSAKTLGKEFKENSTSVFVDFISGLNKIYVSGGDVNKVLDDIGIVADRDQRVLGSLAAKGYGTLVQSMVDVTEASGAMDREFMVASSKLEYVSKRIRTAWDNIVLSIDSGEGIFSKLASLIGQRLAVILEDFNVLLDSLSVNFSLITESISAMIPKGSGLGKMFGKIKDIVIKLPSPFRVLAVALDFLSVIFLVKIPVAISEAITSFLLLRLKIVSFFKLIKTISPILKNIILDILNPFKKADTSGLAKALKDAEKKYLKNASNIKKIGDKNVKNIIDNFNKRKKVIEKEIAIGKKLAGETETETETKTETETNADYQKKQIKGIEILKSSLKELGYTQDNVSNSLDKASLSVDEYAKKTKKAKEVTEEMRAATVAYLSSFTEDFIQNSPLSSLTVFVDGTFASLMDGAAGFGEKFAVTFNAIAESAQQAFAFIDQLGQENFNVQYERLEQQKEFSLKFEVESTAAKEEIERQYEERRAEIQRKQAESEKKRAVFNSVINTAQAIVGALARLPDPSAVPLSIVVGAIGAAQTALIASQPIPQFWQGGVVGSQEIMVNDDPKGVKGSNYKEVIKEPNGKLHFPKGKNVKMKVPKGSYVYPNYDSFFNDIESSIYLNGLSNTMPNAMAINNGLTRSDVESAMHGVISAINGKSSVSVNIDEKGLKTLIFANNTKKEVLNARFRGKTRAV